jgi:hypothetical protein
MEDDVPTPTPDQGKKMNSTHWYVETDPELWDDECALNDLDLTYVANEIGLTNLITAWNRRDELEKRREVTDLMVERACRVFAGPSYVTWDEDEKHQPRERMCAALQAALDHKNDPK